MLLWIVYSHYVLGFYLPISVTVKLLKSFLNELHPVLTHLPPDDSDELLILYLSISVDIECGKYVAYVLAAHLSLEIAASLFELGTRQGLRIVIVHDAEHPGEPNQTPGTPLSHFFSKGIEKVRETIKGIGLRNRYS